MNQRRNFLKSGLALGAAAFVSPTQAAPLLSIEDKFAIAVGPYLQTNFGNEMTILWITNKKSFGWVAYGLNEQELNQTAFGETELGLKAAHSNLNKVTIRNLIPGKTYFYKIFSKEINEFKPYKLTYGEAVSSKVENFINNSPATDKVSFLMLNDIHDRPKSIPHLVNLAKGEKQDFIFFNGDIFDFQTDEQQIINNMLLPCVETFAKQTPFIFVRGNHETRGKFAREFPDYFHKVGYAAFTLGPVRFVILDTGEDKPDTEPVYAGIVDFDGYRMEQAAKLKQEIESKAFKKAPFRVVMMHIPPRFSGEWHGPKHCTELFEPLINKGKVDLVLSGHTHKYIIHQPDAKLNNYPLVIGGGPKDGNRTLTKVIIDRDTLKVQVLDDAGREIGMYTAAKK